MLSKKKKFKKFTPQVPSSNILYCTMISKKKKKKRQLLFTCHLTRKKTRPWWLRTRSNAAQRRYSSMPARRSVNRHSRHKSAAFMPRQGQCQALSCRSLLVVGTEPKTSACSGQIFFPVQYSAKLAQHASTRIGCMSLIQTKLGWTSGSKVAQWQHWFVDGDRLKERPRAVMTKPCLSRAQIRRKFFGCPVDQRTAYLHTRQNRICNHDTRCGKIGGEQTGNIWSRELQKVVKHVACVKCHKQNSPTRKPRRTSAKQDCKFTGERSWIQSTTALQLKVVQQVRGNALTSGTRGRWSRWHCIGAMRRSQQWTIARQCRWWLQQGKEWYQEDDSQSGARSVEGNLTKSLMLLLDTCAFLDLSKNVSDGVLLLKKFVEFLKIGRHFDSRVREHRKLPWLHSKRAPCKICVDKIASASCACELGILNELMHKASAHAWVGKMALNFNKFKFKRGTWEVQSYQVKRPLSSSNNLSSLVFFRSLKRVASSQERDRRVRLPVLLPLLPHSGSVLV